MHKKDYQKIAYVLFTTNEYGDNGQKLVGNEMTKKIAYAMAWELGQDNPRFDSKKFLSACGITE